MRHLDEKLQSLQERLLLMGRLSESMIQLALRILVERNEALGDELMKLMSFRLKSMILP